MRGRRVDFVLNNDILELFSYALMMKVGKMYLQRKMYISTAHTHTMETHSMEKVPSMENFSINQTE